MIMRSQPCRSAVLRSAVAAMALSFTPLAFAQKGQGPTRSQSQSLQQRIDELERRNLELERVNKDLRQKLSAEGKPQPASAPDIKTVDITSKEYRFLELGKESDYLRQERYRIADQIESFIPPLYEPVRPFHAFVLPPGAFRIGLRSRLLFNNEDFGRDDHYAKLFQNVRVRSQTMHLSLAYGFELPKLPDMTLLVDLPYRAVQVSGSGHPGRMDANVLTMNGSGSGVGDITITLKKKWLDQGNFPVNVATFTGLTLPTGNDNEQFNAAQSMTVAGAPVPSPTLNLFGRTPTDRLLPPMLQPCQGAWGFRVGGAATRQFARSALHAGLIADIFLDNDGIVVGDEFKYGLSYVFPPLASDVLTIDLSLFGRHKEDSKFPGVGIMGPRANFKHGSVLFFSPSVVFIPSPQIRFFLSPEVRILEPNKGPSPAFAFTAGATLTF